MHELFQTEWCPASRRIRQRLTELGLDYVNPDEHCREPADAEAHRAKAAKAGRRHLEEECACSRLATH